jgi:hypothetical protein
MAWITAAAQASVKKLGYQLGYHRHRKIPDFRFVNTDYRYCDFASNSAQRHSAQRRLFANRFSPSGFI